MWTWSLTWGEITPRMLIGSCPMRPEHLVRIHEDTGISALFSLQHEECHAYWQIDYPTMCRTAAERGIEMSRCAIRDLDVGDMRRHLAQAVTALAHLQARGHRTYVHCTAGLGRAPLVVLGYLTLVRRLAPEEAIDLILKGRPGAVPAWEAYYGCIEDLVGKYRQEIERLAYMLYLEGTNGSAEEDWRAAQAEVLRAVLTHGDTSYQSLVDSGFPIT